MNEYRSSDRPVPSSLAPNKLTVILLLLLTVAVGYLFAERASFRRSRFDEQINRQVTPRGDLAADEKATIELFQNSSKSVVNITTLTRSRRMFTGDVTEQPGGTGSGFVWDELGHIVTNFHVISNADELLVTFADQSTVGAELVGVAPHKDLAVLRVKLPASALSPIAVGKSSDLLVGQKVFAIGNPFGLDQTLTTGVVSQVGRMIRSKTDRPIFDVIQTNAAINPGNSGGPLLDSAGRLIGVNTAIYSPSGASAGIGFAIPADTVRRVVPQLVKNGRVISPTLGIVPFNPNQTKAAGLKGVLVQQLAEGGPAETAGIEPFRFNQRRQIIYGDLIVELGDRKINEIDDLFVALESHNIGDEVQVTVIRGANTRSPEQLSVNVQLGATVVQ